MKKIVVKTVGAEKKKSVSYVEAYKNIDKIYCSESS